MSGIVDKLRDGKWNETATSEDAAISRAYEIMEEAAGTIEALRAQLKETLDRESGTTERYDARVERLQTALQGFTHRQRELGRLAEGDLPDSYVVSVGCTLGDYRRAQEAQKEVK